MLNLTRKEGDAIIIGGDIRIVISRIDGRYVKVSISAPADVKILREELLKEHENKSTRTLDANV